MTHHTPQRRRTTTVILAATATLGLAAGLAGCSGDNPPDPIPTVSTSPTPTSTPTPSWESKYTPEELAAYEAALDRWTEYETKSEPIWAAGKATPAAKALFQEYFPSPLWQGRFELLKGYEKIHAKTIGSPKVFWTRPVQVNSVAVKFEQCVDYTTAKTTATQGTVLPRAKELERPVLRTTKLSKPKGYNWLIYEEDHTPAKKLKPCSPESGGM